MKPLPLQDQAGDTRPKRDPTPGLWVGLGSVFAFTNLYVLATTWLQLIQILTMLGIGFAVFVRGAVLCWRVRGKYGLLAAASIFTGLTYALLAWDIVVRHFGSNAEKELLVAVMGPFCYLAHLLALPFNKGQDRVRESPDAGPTVWVGLGWLIALANIYVLSTTWFEMDQILWLLGIGIAAFIWGAILSWKVRSRFRLLTAASTLSGLTYALLGWYVYEGHLGSNSTLQIMAVAGIVCYTAHLWGLTIRKDRGANPDESGPSTPVPQR